MMLISLLFSLALSSSNGKYYKCDETKLTNDKTCFFSLVTDYPGDAGNDIPKYPDTWPTQSDGITPNDSPAVDQYKACVKTMDYSIPENGACLIVSPKPWAQGDNIVATTEEQKGEAWNYVMAAQLVFPLRNKIMIEPDQLRQSKTDFEKYTKVFTDCGIKTTTTTNAHGHEALSTSKIWDLVSTDTTVDTHNQLLMYLEEGTIDLVCLITDLDMPERCDPIREAMGTTKGNYCDCFKAAYKDITGKDEYGDSTFNTCSPTTAAAAGDTTSTAAAADDTTGTAAAAVSTAKIAGVSSQKPSTGAPDVVPGTTGSASSNVAAIFCALAAFIGVFLF